MPKRKNKLNRYNVDINRNYVMELTSKIEKLAVFVCYGYVSQTPDTKDGTEQNVFYDELFHCHFKRRRIDSIRGFLRAVGLTGVNEYEFKKLLDFGLPTCDSIDIPYYNKEGKRIILTLKNFPPVFLSEDKDPDTGELLGRYINVMAWDPIMYDYYSSLNPDVAKKFQELTPSKFNLALRVTNYYRENREKLKGKPPVRNLSRDNVDRVLQIDTVREPAHRNEKRCTALQKCKEIGLLAGYKLFLESVPEVTLASVEDFHDISKRNLLSARKLRNPDMVTLIFNKHSFK